MNSGSGILPANSKVWLIAWGKREKTFSLIPIISKQRCHVVPEPLTNFDVQLFCENRSVSIHDFYRVHVFPEPQKWVNFYEVPRFIFKKSDIKFEFHIDLDKIGTEELAKIYEAAVKQFADNIDKAILDNLKPGLV